VNTAVELQSEIRCSRYSGEIMTSRDLLAIGTDELPGLEWMTLSIRLDEPESGVCSGNPRSAFYFDGAWRSVLLFDGGVKAGLFITY
jgi:hypothetical protein